jgi:hypothetical protein
MKLLFAAKNGFSITLKDITSEEFAVIQLIEAERAKLESEKYAGR